jgi:hypothetical protein
MQAAFACIRKYEWPPRGGRFFALENLQVPRKRTAAVEHRAACSGSKAARATTHQLRYGGLTTAPCAGGQEEPSVNSQATDPRMIESLEGASSLQLYQLKALIEGMLADPRRGIAARAGLHLGQAVWFVDFRDGQMRRGKIIAMKDTQATVLEEGTKRTWKIPA